MNNDIGTSMVSPLPPKKAQADSNGGADQAQTPDSRVGISETMTTMSFIEMMEYVISGHEMTRLAWEAMGDRSYVFISDERLRIHLGATELDHPWIISKQDIDATDWIKILKA